MDSSAGLRLTSHASSPFFVAMLSGKTLETSPFSLAMRFVILATISVALFFTPWGKVLTTHHPQGYLELQGGGQPTPGMVQAIEQATGRSLQAKTETTGYQYGFHIGFVGFTYLVCASLCLLVSLLQASNPKQRTALAMAVLSAIGFLATAILFLPSMHFLAWGASLAMLSMLSIFIVSLAWLLSHKTHSSKTEVADLGVGPKG